MAKKANKPDPEFTATLMAEMLGLTLARVGQLAKEGRITKKKNGKYAPSAVCEYIRWRIDEAKGNDWSVLLEQEKYREKKRQNDEAEGLLAPVQVLEEALARTVSVMSPILDGLPLIVKRHFPELTGDQLHLVKIAVAECRNAMADAELKLDD